MEAISIREFGRRIGFTDTYVRRMMANGVLTKKSLTTNKKNGRPEIIYEVALAEWRANYGEVKKSEVKPMATKRAKGEDDSRQPGDIPGTGPSKAEIDRRLAQVKLQKEAIELKKLQGGLLEKQKVYATLYGFGQELRTALMQVPDRIIDELLSCTDRNVAHNKLTEAIASELERMSEFQERELTSERK